MLTPVITYPLSAILLPVIFHFVNRKFVCFSIVLAVIIDLLMYWDAFSYYEWRGLYILLTAAQIIAMIIVILLLKHFMPKSVK